MPLLWLSLAFLGGILLAQTFALPISTFVVLAGLAIVFLIPPISRRVSSHLPTILSQGMLSSRLSPGTFYPLLFLCMAMGGLRYQLAQPRLTPSFIAFYNDTPAKMMVEGVIVAVPDVRESYSNLRINVEQLADLAQPSPIGAAQRVNGDLQVRLPANMSFAYGDRVRLQGRVVTPPEYEDFSYRDYLANHGVYSYMAYPAVTVIEHGKGNRFYSVMYAFRQHAVNLLYTLYPDPEASLVAGIVLGVQSGIQPDMQEAFRLTGTSHIIVISGFNITIIAFAFTSVFSKILGKRRGAITAAVGIIFYTLLVGASPAVLRAAFLGLLALLAHQLGRHQSGLISLAFAAAVLAILTPTILWDVSFQLSFAATLGIMLYAEPLTRWFTRLAEGIASPTLAHRISGPVSAYILLTLAAQLTTLPLMAYYFKRISLTALVANPLILPAQPPLMILGGMSILTGLILRPLGQLLAWAAWVCAAYTIRVVEWFAAIPHGSLAIANVALPLIVLFYTILFAITFFHSRLLPIARRLVPALPFVVLSVATIFVWNMAYHSPDGLLHVTILDVGTGEGVLIQSPTGRDMLINGGSSTVALSNSLGRRLPPINRSLDWLVVAGTSDEDLAGVPDNIERFMPANILWSGNTDASRSSRELQLTINKLSIPTSLMLPGQSLDLGFGARLEVLSTNARGAVLFLEWEDFRMLLPMGMDFNALDSLQRNMAIRNISAMLLPESGYAPLNPPELIDFIHPQLAVLSVAPGDKTGLPSPETLQALQGYNLLRTDQNGWIQITTNGNQMWVEVARK